MRRYMTPLLRKTSILSLRPQSVKLVLANGCGTLQIHFWAKSRETHVIREIIRKVRNLGLNF